METQRAQTWNEGGGGGEEEEEDDDDGDLLLDEEFLLQSLLDVSEALDKLRKISLRSNRVTPGVSTSGAAVSSGGSGTLDAVARGMAQKLDSLFQIAALGDASSEYLVANGVVELAGRLISFAGTEADLAPESAVYECLQLACGLVANLVVVSKAARAILFTQSVEGIGDSSTCAGKSRQAEKPAALREVCEGSKMHDGGSSAASDGGGGSAVRLSFHGFKLLVALLGTIETCRDVRALDEGLRCIFAFASYASIDDPTVFAIGGPGTTAAEPIAVAWCGVLQRVWQLVGAVLDTACLRHCFNIMSCFLSRGATSVDAVRHIVDAVSQPIPDSSDAVIPTFAVRSTQLIFLHPLQLTDLLLSRILSSRDFWELVSNDDHLGHDMLQCLEHSINAIETAPTMRDTESDRPSMRSDVHLHDLHQREAILLEISNRSLQMVVRLAHTDLWSGGFDLAAARGLASKAMVVLANAWFLRDPVLDHIGQVMRISGLEWEALRHIFVTAAALPSGDSVVAGSNRIERDVLQRSAAQCLAIIDQVFGSQKHVQQPRGATARQ